MSLQPVIFYSEGQRISGDLSLPREGAPGILLSHGFESSKDGDKWLLLSSRFYDAGFASLRFNYRGCGKGEEKSEGEFEDTTLTGRIRDYKAALDYLETTGVDTGRLGVMGSSFGGMIALAARDERIRAMVILATPSYFPPPGEGELRSFKQKGYFQLQSGRRLKTGFLEDVKEYHIIEDIKKIRRPILVIHGSPAEHAYGLHENAPEPRGLEIIEGGNHGFDNPEHIERIAGLSLEWFERYLSPERVRPSL
jgi:dipeptidyl aminopeptidase/acylaminoacyl peptidase